LLALLIFCFLLVDARPLTNAVAQHALNAGFEGATYLNCKIQFFGIPNIHAIRDANKRLRAVCMSQDELNRREYLAALEATQWLEIQKLVLSAAVFTVDKIEVRC
jgi:hypothetical protein